MINDHVPLVESFRNFRSLQGLNLVVNHPTGGSVNIAGGSGRNPGDSSSAARRLQASGGPSGAAGGAMANEGRWTDNGQPLTAAEGRTVLPMLDQVEQAIVARLLPSPAVDRTRRPGGGAGGDGGGGGIGGEEVRNTQAGGVGGGGRRFLS